VGDRGRAVQWADARRLLVLALPAGGEPQAFRMVRSQLGAADRHAAQARGEATATVLGSGRYLGVDRRDPPLRLRRGRVGLPARGAMRRLHDQLIGQGSCDRGRRCPSR
jgi:hypothetical protein